MTVLETAPPLSLPVSVTEEDWEQAAEELLSWFNDLSDEEFLLAVRWCQHLPARPHLEAIREVEALLPMLPWGRRADEVHRRVDFLTRWDDLAEMGPARGESIGGMYNAARSAIALLFATPEVSEETRELLAGPITALRLIVDAVRASPVVREVVLGLADGWEGTAVGLVFAATALAER